MAMTAYGDDGLWWCWPVVVPAYDDGVYRTVVLVSGACRQQLSPDAHTLPQLPGHPLQAPGNLLTNVHSFHTTCHTKDFLKADFFYVPQRESISRAWCKTIVTTSFYIMSYNSFAPSPRYSQRFCPSVSLSIPTSVRPSAFLAHLSTKCSG